MHKPRNRGRSSGARNKTSRVSCLGWCFVQRWQAGRPDCAHQVAEPRFCCTHGPLYICTECCVVKLCIVLLVVGRVLEKLTCMSTTPWCLCMNLTMRMTYSIFNLLCSNSSNLSCGSRSVWTIFTYSMKTGKRNRVSKIVFPTIDLLKENINNFHTNLFIIFRMHKYIKRTWRLILHHRHGFHISTFVKYLAGLNYTSPNC
jgi:hypothetical protein